MKRSGRLRPLSAKRAAERRKAQRVIDAVFARDDGCVLRTRHELVGRCYGARTPHHLTKAWKGSGWTMDNIVCLCAHHNGWVENWPDTAWGLGLVVRNGDTTGHAWVAMRNAGLAVGGES